MLTTSGTYPWLFVPTLLYFLFSFDKNQYVYADRNRSLNFVDDYVYSPGDPLTATKKRDLMVSHIRYIFVRHSEPPKIVLEL